MKKILTFSLVILFSLIFFISCRQKEPSEVPASPRKTGFLSQIPSSEDQGKAISLAKEIYAQKKKNGVNFQNGPCLSENLMTDWVADIAHFPREGVDNNPANQCSSYGEGKAHHFVELDENGELIRAL